MFQALGSDSACITSFNPDSLCKDLRVVTLSCKTVVVLKLELRGHMTLTQAATNQWKNSKLSLSFLTSKPEVLANIL